MTILNEYEQDLIDSGVINKVIVQGNLVDDPLYGDILILYTEKGQKDALLLIKYLENKIARIEKLKKMLESSGRRSDICAAASTCCTASLRNTPLISRYLSGFFIFGDGGKSSAESPWIVAL